MRRAAALLLWVSLATAWEFPFAGFWEPSPQTPLSAPQAASPSPPRVAIIGAGAAGSSAAFWISKAKERYGVDVDVDIYEANDYIGGRACPLSRR